MPGARDPLSRAIDVSEQYARRRTTAGRIGILPDDSESDRTRLFGMPATASRRGGRIQPQGGGGFRRGRGGRRASRSVLPVWYPRTPLGDITHIVRAIDRRRERLGDGDGLTVGSPTPLRVYQDTADQDPSPSGAHLEHESLVIFADLPNRESGDSEFLTPQMQLLNSIDVVEKVFLQELNKLKRTPTAKKAERDKKVRTLMLMR